MLIVGRIDEAVRYSDAGQVAFARSREGVPPGFEALLGGVFTQIGQPHRSVEWCGAELAKVKGIYVVVTAHVTNNGTKSHGLDSMFQKLHIGAKEYQANPFANMGASSQIKTSVYVDPGFSDDVTFVFDVPQSSVSMGTTSSFTEKTVLDVSGGLGGEAPNDVNVVL